jgi:hypothetical protein
VQVIGAKGLKGSFFDRMDAFVLAEVREGRPLKVRGDAQSQAYGPLARRHLVCPWPSSLPTP